MARKNKKYGKKQTFEDYGAVMVKTVAKLKDGASLVVRMLIHANNRKGMLKVNDLMERRLKVKEVKFFFPKKKKRRNKKTRH